MVEKKIINEWKEITLEEIANFQKGYAFKSKEFLEKGIKIVKVSNLTSDSISENGILHVEKDSFKKYQRYQLSYNDLIITTVGSWPNNPASVVGKVVRVPEIFDESLLNQNAVRVTSKDINQNFIYYLLKDKLFKHYIVNTAQGSASQASITQKDIKKYTVKIPKNLEECRKIGEVLRSLDDKIEVNNQMNQTLEEMAQAIFKEWFVEFNFPNEDGVPYKDNGGEMVESELGEIPEGWRVSNFGEVSNCYDSKRIPLSKNKRAERQGEYPYYGATSIMDYVDDYIFEGIYLMLGEDGSVIKEDGTPFIQYVWGKIWVNNHAHVLQGKNGISTEHLLVFSKQTDLNPYITGAVQLKLNQRNMNSIPFIRANNDIENSFNKIIQPLFSKIRAIYNENQTLIKTRDTLLPKLMSGEVRV